MIEETQPTTETEATPAPEAVQDPAPEASQDPAPQTGQPDMPPVEAAQDDPKPAPDAPQEPEPEPEPLAAQGGEPQQEPEPEQPATEGEAAQGGEPDPDAPQPSATLTESGDTMLIGSSVQPADIQIGEALVSLGDVVRKAHADSGLSVDDWNKLDDEAREQHIAEAVEAMRSAALPEDEEAAPEPEASEPDELAHTTDAKVGDTVFYRQAEGERTVNGQRTFTCGIIGLKPGNRVDLRAWYGTGRGWGELFNVPHGEGPGCWKA